MAIPLKALLVLVPVALSLLIGLGLGPLLAATANPGDNVGHVKIAVCDLDGLNVGVALKAFFTQVSATVPKIPTYEIITAANAEELRGKVRGGDYWGAVWVNPASTAKLMGFVGTGGFASSNATIRASYKANGALSFAWDESRDYLVSAKYVGVVTRTLLNNFQQQFARGLITQLSSTAGLVGAIGGSARNDLLFAPVAFTEESLFPFEAPVALQTEIIGNLVNIVIGYAVGLVCVFLLRRKLTGWSNAGIAHAQVVTIFFYCMVTAATIATISVGLGATYKTGSEAAYHADGPMWAQMWSTQWLLMLGFAYYFGGIGYALGSPTAVPAFLFITVLWNATSYLVDTANHGYEFFWWAPMWHANNVMRRIQFGSMAGVLDRSVGILFLWLGVSLIWFYAWAAVAARRTPAPPAAKSADSPFVPVKAADEATPGSASSPDEVTVA